MTDVKPIAKPALELACTIVVETDSDQIYDLPKTPWGTSLVVDVTGGTVTGPLLNGTLLPSGADWGLLVPSLSDDLTLTNLDARLMIRLDDGTDVTFRYRGISYTRPGVTPAPVPKGGIKDPADFYTRTLVSLRTASQKHDWINRTVFVGSGTHREQAGPIYSLYAVR